ncbi:hypothetical protein [Andreprevotia chitinilytica]|uniref:hypothetical protein n=1 Tax=Andreprevotia chitinilytica TaxID=396808 RepID=UPI00068E9D22|nr:hypothetical protein [Andreprevotia chitinilytica]
MRTLRPGLLAAVFGIASLAALADEFTVDAGMMRREDRADSSYAWSASYLHPFGEHIAGSFSWLNEGHVRHHHRDGYSAQVWLRSTPMLSDHLILSAGVGPYRYFDTQQARFGNTYANNHGWGTVYSLAATWQAQNDWLYQLRLNHIRTIGSIDTTSLVFGVGYQLTPDNTGSSSDIGEANQREIAVFVGQSIANDLDKNTGFASSVEYRQTISPWIKASAALVNEGNNQIRRRNGAILEGWLEPEFFKGRVSLGVGAGAYISIDHRDVAGDTRNYSDVSGIVTLTASYRVADHWRARLDWHRIVTTYSKDADIVLLGAGYQF